MGALDNARLEARIATLEATVARLSSSAPVERTGGRPPRPTTPTVDAQPGVVAINWTATTIGDLLNYEVQVADNDAFTGAELFTSTNNQFTYYGGSAGVTYYLRVRVRNRSQQASEWSASVSATIGLVTEELLDSDDAEPFFHFYSEYSNSTFADLSAVNNDCHEYILQSVTTQSATSVVILNIHAKADFDVHFPSTANNNSLTVTVRRVRAGESIVTGTVGQTIFTETIDIHEEYPDAGTTTPTGLLNIALPSILFDVPGTAGSWDYYARFGWSAGGSNYIYLTNIRTETTAIVLNP